MYDPMLDADLEKFTFYLMGAVVCFAMQPMATLLIGVVMVGLRSYVRWKNGRWEAK